MYAVFQSGSKSTQKTKILLTAASILANTVAAKAECQAIDIQEKTYHPYTNQKAERQRSRKANQDLKNSRR